jgi:hypothetical protein
MFRAYLKLVEASKMNPDRKIAVDRSILDATLPVADWMAKAYHSNFDKQVLEGIRMALTQNGDEVIVPHRLLVNAKETVQQAYTNARTASWGELLKTLDSLVQHS